MLIRKTMDSLVLEQIHRFSYTSLPYKKGKLGNFIFYCHKPS